MNDLISVLNQMREKVNVFRGVYERNEEAVRIQIVNPILSSVGWDPADPTKVLHNDSTDEGIPDYTLIRDGKTWLFIEAKNLSTDVSNERVLRQLGRYSFGEGTLYGVLTNGMVWVLIRSFESGTTFPDRIIWQANLEKDSPHFLIRKLSTISYENIVQIDWLVEQDNLLESVYENIWKEPETIASSLLPIVRDRVRMMPGSSARPIEDVDINDFLVMKLQQTDSPAEPETISSSTGGDLALPHINSSTTNKLPRSMTIQGTRFELRYAYEILINTGNWLIGKGKLRANECPISVTRGSRYLINREPKHSNGKRFWSQKTLSNGLYVETDDSQQQMRDYSKRLLEKYNYRGSDLKFEE